MYSRPSRLEALRYTARWTDIASLAGRGDSAKVLLVESHFPVLRVLATTLLGAALSFPAAVMWFFEWVAPTPGAVCWGLYAMLIAGGLGGLLWAISGLNADGRHPLLSVLAGGLVFGPLAALPIFAFLVRSGLA